MIDPRNTKTNSIIIWGFAVGFCLIFFYFFQRNIELQRMPNVSFNTLATGWQVDARQSSSIPTDTIITNIVIDDKRYKIDEGWLFPSFLSFNTYEAMQAGYAKERILFLATQPDQSQASALPSTQHADGFKPIVNIKLYDQDGHSYRLKLRDFTLTDINFYTLLLYAFGAIKFFISWSTAKVGPFDNKKLVFILASLSVSLICFLSVAVIDRAWAIDPEVLQRRQMTMNLIYRLNFFFLMIMWLQAPVNLFTKYRYVKHYLALIFICLIGTWWLCFFHDMEKYRSLLILPIYVALILAIGHLFWQWRLIQRPENYSLSASIAIKWLLILLLCSGLLVMALNIMIHFGMVEGEYGSFLFIFNSILFSFGAAALILHTHLYKIEKWWWSIWGLISAIPIALAVLSLLMVFKKMELSVISLTISAVIGVLVYILTVNYFRIKYTKAERNLGELLIPSFLKLNAKNISEPYYNQVWLDILYQVFKPKYIELMSASDYPNITPHFKDITLKKHPDANTEDMPSAAKNNPTSTKFIEGMIDDAGDTLILKALDNKVAVLKYSANGLKLFTQENLGKSLMLWDMLWQSYLSSISYAAGEAAERNRIAWDLHDDIGGKLLHLSSQEGEYGDYALRTLQDLRTLTHALSDESKTLSLIIADMRYKIHNYCDNKDIDLKFHIELDEELANKPLPVDSSVNFICILNEITRNAVQHTHTANICIHIRVNAQRCRLIVKNDGDKTNPLNWIQGLGTVSSERRVNELEGEITWKARENGGVKCQANWPTKNMFHHQS